MRCETFLRSKLKTHTKRQKGPSFFLLRVSCPKRAYQVSSASAKLRAVKNQGRSYFAKKKKKKKKKKEEEEEEEEEVVVAVDI